MSRLGLISNTMNPKVFRLLDLPWIPIKIILMSSEEMIQMVHLACKNTRFRRLLMAFKLPVEMITWELNGRYGMWTNKIVIHTDGKRLTVDVNRKFLHKQCHNVWSTERGNLFAKFGSYKCDHEDEEDEEDNVEDGEDLYENDEMRLSICPEQELPICEELELISKYLLKFLKPKKVSISFGGFKSDTTAFDDCFIWDSFKEFSKVSYNSCCQISPKQLKYCLEDIKTDELKLVVRVTENLCYTGPALRNSNTTTLRLKQSKWFDLDYFFNTFKTPSVFYTASAQECANRILKSWVNSKEEGIEELYICLENGGRRQPNLFYEEKELLDIDCTPVTYTPNELEKLTGHFQSVLKKSPPPWNHRFSIENGWDIKRKSDQRRATVWFPNRKRMAMIIWTPKQIAKFS